MAEIGTTKRRLLGELIEQCTQVNSELKYGVKDAMGMTITKEIIPTKANLDGTDLSNFLIVAPKEFVYNPRTHGKKIGSGFNNSTKSFIISWNNVAFRVKDTAILYPDYLYLIISRNEWDREACFRSWGSSTEVFSWTEFCLMEIPLPSIEVQRELVEVYNGFKELAEQNEALLPQLSAACHAYIVDCRDKYPSVTLGDYIEEYNVINSDNSIKTVKSVSVFKEFRDTNAKVNKEELSKYKIVQPGMMSYVQTTKNEKCFACCVNHYDEPIVVTSVNKVFYVTKPKELNIDFLFLFLNRKEFDRFAIFNSWGSAREVFQWEDLKAVQIPLPPIEVQQAIVDVYQCAERAKQIATEARERMKNLCPALVQRAANS